ncbi:MAG: RNA polymerase sigma factor [Bacteroidota bacterium]
MSTTQEQSLQALLEACKAGDRAAYGTLYQAYYSYAMSICLRYSSSREEAQEIVNDGFVKVFLRLQSHYDPKLSFKAWLRRLLINTAIDVYRKQKYHRESMPLESAPEVEVSEDGLSRLTQEEIMKVVQLLPNSYRYVFNLYIVEGYKHEEIAQQLGISVGTSKSHLAKARRKLKIWLKQMYQIERDG